MSKKRYTVAYKKYVFDWILSYKKANQGATPTLQQIVDGTGVSSKSMARKILIDLEEMGFIERPRHNQIDICNTVFLMSPKPEVGRQWLDHLKGKNND